MKRCRSRNIEVVTMSHSYSTERDEVFSAFSEEEIIFLCDSCLRIFKERSHLESHSDNCPNAFWIPGQEIYRCGKRNLSIFEIDGRKHISVCFLRRLSILTKLFLPDKITLDDVHFFAFTALFEVDDYGYHFAGYFSKEWQNSRGCFNTLSCIMVLPPYKGKGYGSLLAELSYEIGRRELSEGTPERPLSWGGKLLFRKIWREEVMRAVNKLKANDLPITLGEICRTSGLIVEDALVGLHDSKSLFTVGRQGPFIVIDEKDVPCMKRRRLCQEFLEWESMV